MAEEQTTDQTQTAGEAQPAEPSDFAALLQEEFKPRTTRVQEQVESAVRTLSEYVLKDVNLVSPDAVR
ncbi:MAG: hypothetical protein KAS40_18570, partial [Desulfobacterales bacterium]|nr:hypothetical protein [Desulfobacterales bacterium]